MDGRQILNDILIANELIDSRKWTKKPGVIFKIDMEKAFDWYGCSASVSTVRLCRSPT